MIEDIFFSSVWFYSDPNHHTAEETAYKNEKETI